MNDDFDVYFDKTGCYVESLLRSRQYLKNCPSLLYKLDEVIQAEIELALMGAKKAISEILKDSKDNVRPIK